MEQPSLTMRELVESFELLHLSGLKESTRYGVQHKIRKYFGTLLHLPVSSLTLRTVLAWHNDIKAHSKTQADSCLSILRNMFNKAIEWGLFTGPNPTSCIKRKHPSARQRYVLAQEHAQLLGVIERQPLMERVYFYFILFTGCRPGEAEKALITDLQATKTGYLWRKGTTKNGEEQWVPLPDKLAELLKLHVSGLPPQTKWVFENPKRRKPYGMVFWCRRWADIRQVVGLGPSQDETGHNIRGSAVRRHDLRRTCSTQLLNDRSEHRLNLLELSRGVLNHTNIETTRIYAIPDLSRIQAALNENMNRAFATKGDASCDTSLPSGS